MNNEIENYEKLILELTDLDIQTNGRLNEVQRVQLELYKKIYLLLKSNNNLQEENERLKQMVDWNDKVANKKQDRIEKAVGKLKKIQQNAIKYGAEHDVVVCQELIDGLNGRSDE